MRGKYCIVLPGEGNEFELSTKDTLISRRVMCLVGSFVVDNILKRLHVVKKTEISYFKCNTEFARSMLDSPAKNQFPTFITFFPKDHFFIERTKTFFFNS